MSHHSLKLFICSKKKKKRHKQDYLRRLFPPRVKSSMRGKSTFRADTLTLAMEVACSITVSSKSDRDWVARIGSESVFAAVTKILAQVVD